MSGALGLARDLASETSAFLAFCRVEKGLSANSLHAYTSDLQRFISFFKQGGMPDGEGIRRYLDSMHRTGLSNRSVARHLTTLRNFFGYLLREGRAESDPTEHLRSPKQWQTI